jgi:hypothetical protein
LTTCGKNWGQEGGKGGGNYSKKGACTTAGERLLVASWPRHRPPTPSVLPNFIIIIIIFIFFGTYEDLPSILEERVYSTAIFLSLPLYLEVLQLPFFMKVGDFNFFKFFF